MVGKLIKHELLAIFRVLLYMSVVSLVLSCIARIFMATGNEIGSVIFTMFAVWVAAVMIFVSFIVSISRFYQSLFKAEGYMTFSLPVSATQLLISKLISAIIAMFIGVAVFALSCTIIFTGFGGELWEEIVDTFSQVLNIYGSLLASDPLMIVEMILLLIVQIPMSLLFFFLIESLGQMFTNHRKAYTFGIAIAAITVISLVSSLCLESILMLLAKANTHLVSWIQIIVYAGLDVGFFFATRYILTHKLNLVV